MSNKIKISSKSLGLSGLRTHFERGIFAVPEIQREFVWDQKKACKLLDSIYHGYPIGNVLVWRTIRNNEHLLRSRLHILPPFNSANSDIWFLIDGQQRLSVLWQILRGSGNQVTNESGKKIDFGWIRFDASRSPAGQLFRHTKRAPSEHHVAVVDILARNWRTRLRGLHRSTLSRVERCRERLMAYKLRLTVMDGGDLAAVRETFIRINSLGMEIRSADRAFARATQLNLRHLVRGLQARLSHGFDSLSEEAVLLTCGLAMQQPDIGARAVEAMVDRIENDTREAKEFRRRWRKVSNSIAYTVDYLVESFGVANYGCLPSDNMVAVLAQFFLAKGNRRPNRKQKEEIGRWFWATAVGSRYAGRGWRANIPADARFMRKLAETGQGRFKGVALQPLHVLKHADYSRRGMLTDGYFCLLRRIGPRYLEDGEPVPLDLVSARANRKEKHHIFPKQALANKGITARDYNSLPNICMIVARENQAIGAKQPRFYLKDLMSSKRTLNKALRSHLIPFGENSGMWEPDLKRGFKRFVAKRAELIARAFEQEAGMKLFVR
ncbi:MAG: DUF262 domain-containing protein [Polyangia bacterium]